MRSPEFVIVGQGLAGTALAWHLLRRGRSVLVVDRESGNSASRLAAGLITPVTGKRLAKSWRWDELYPAAFAFYRAVETETVSRFFHPRVALRIVRDEPEQAEFYRRAGTILAGLVPPDLHPVSSCYEAPFGAFEMSSARLDVPRYLDTSREHFRARGSYLAAEIDPRGVAPTANGVWLTSLSVSARAAIFCRGFSPEADPFFGAVAFNAAKGEVLTVRVPGLGEDRAVHCGLWLAPRGTPATNPDDIYDAGATYSWDPLDSVPTAEGRVEIESRLRTFLKRAYEVLDHRAAVRPVIDAGFPVLGTHPQYAQLAYFNGLGSKGSLLAPFFANQLAAHLCGEGEIDGAVDVRKFLVHPRPAPG